MLRLTYMRKALTLPLITLLFLLLSVFATSAQSEDVVRLPSVDAQCGGIYEGQFTHNAEIQTYVVPLEGGDMIRARIVPLGQGLETVMMLGGPTGLFVTSSDSVLNGGEVGSLRTEPVAQPSVETTPLASPGNYSIYIMNFSMFMFNSGRVMDDLNTLPEYNRGMGDPQPAGLGVYTLYISCTLRSGDVIDEGEIIVPTAMLVEPDTDTGQSTNFIQIPDLIASSGEEILFNDPVMDIITPSDNQVKVYTLAIPQDTALNLTIQRTIGNMNLGIVIEDGTNQLIFQSTIFTNETHNFQFNVPNTELVTIGVFETQLYGPSMPEATAFEMTIFTE